VHRCTVQPTVAGTAAAAAAAVPVGPGIGRSAVDIGRLVDGIGRFAAASTGDRRRPVARTATARQWRRAVVQRIAIALAAAGTGADDRLAGPETAIAVRRTRRVAVPCTWSEVPRRGRQGYRSTASTALGALTCPSIRPVRPITVADVGCPNAVAGRCPVARQVQGWTPKWATVGCLFVCKRSGLRLPMKQGVM